MPIQVYQLSASGRHAIELLEEAIGMIRDGEDAISVVCHAEAVLRAEVGEAAQEDENAAFEAESHRRYEQSIQDAYENLS
jgi:hypothetical protein